MKLKKKILVSVALISSLILSLPVLDTQAATAVGTVKEFKHKTSVQTYTAPETGYYKLEAWGGQGGGYSAPGYATGYINLKKNESIYVYVGGSGSILTKNTTTSGGWNGGGAAYKKGSGTGGGATHFAKSKVGTLNTIAAIKDETKLAAAKADVLLVAGGSGGQPSDYVDTYDYPTGSGKTASTYTGEVAVFGTGGGVVGAQGQVGGSRSFGVGGAGSQTGNTYELNGVAYTAYGGAGGGGWLGGVGSVFGWYKTHEELGVAAVIGGFGGGGSGYISEELYGDERLTDGVRKYDAKGAEIHTGYATVTYMGPVECDVTVSIDSKAGSIDGKAKQTYSVGATGTLTLPEVTMNDGYVFRGFNITSINTDAVLTDTSVTVEFSDVEIEVIYTAPIETTAKTGDAAEDGSKTVELSWIQPDNMLNKRYTVYQSFDGTDWFGIDSEKGDYIDYTDIYKLYTRPSVNGHGSSPSASYSVNYTVEYDGVYKVWLAGASGGTSYGLSANGKGGSLSAYVALQKGDILTFRIGGRGGHAGGGDSENKYRAKAGWNGGGAGEAWYTSPSWYGGAGGGGGATTLNLTRGTYAATLMMSGGGHGGNVSGTGVTKGGYKLAQPSLNKIVGATAGAASSGGTGGGGGGYAYESYSMLNKSSNVNVTLIENLAGGWTGADGRATIEAYELYSVLSDTEIEALIQDVKAPDVPTGLERTPYHINWLTSKDNGNDNYFKVKSVLYDEVSGEKTDLSEGEPIKLDTIISGLYGYYYILDTSDSTSITQEVVDAGTAKFTTETQTVDDDASVENISNYTYIHVASVDKAGNISETNHIAIADIKYNARYDITYISNYDIKNTEDSKYTYTKEYAEEYYIEEIKFNHPAPKWYFVAYNTKADGSGDEYLPGNLYDINEDITLYAQWMKDEYDIVYYSNNTKNEVARDTKLHGKNYSVLDCGFTPVDWYYYSGVWNTEPDGSGKTYTYGDIYKLNKDLDLYAQWTSIDALSITGKVFWNDLKNTYGSRPDTIDLKFTGSDSKVYVATVTGSSTSAFWSYDTIGLVRIPELDSKGNPITYTLSQDTAISKSDAGYYEKPIITGLNTVNAFIMNTTPNIQSTLNRKLGNSAQLDEENEFKAGETAVLVITARGFIEKLDINFPLGLISLNGALDKTYNLQELSNGYTSDYNSNGIEIDSDNGIVKISYEFVIPSTTPLNSYTISMTGVKGVQKVTDSQRLTVTGDILTELKTKINMIIKDKKY